MNLVQRNCLSGKQKLRIFLYIFAVNIILVIFCEIKGDLIKYSTIFYSDLRGKNISVIWAIDKEKLYILLCWILANLAVPFKVSILAMLVSSQYLAILRLMEITKINLLFLLLPIFPLLVSNEFQIFRQYLAIYIIIAAYPRRWFGWTSLLIHKISLLYQVLIRLPNVFVLLGLISYVVFYSRLKLILSPFTYYQDAYVSSAYSIFMACIVVFAVCRRMLPMFFLILVLLVVLPLNGEIQGRVLNGLNILVPIMIAGLYGNIRNNRYMGLKVFLYGITILLSFGLSLNYIS
jgi:hypothetical protein